MAVSESLKVLLMANTPWYYEQKKPLFQRETQFDSLVISRLSLVPSSLQHIDEGGRKDLIRSIVFYTKCNLNIFKTGKKMFTLPPRGVLLGFHVMDKYKVVKIVKMHG